MTAQEELPERIIYASTNDDGASIVSPCSRAINSGLNSGIQSTTDITLVIQEYLERHCGYGGYEMETNPGAILGHRLCESIGNWYHERSSWAKCVCICKQPSYIAQIPLELPPAPIILRQIINLLFLHWKIKKLFWAAIRHG